MPSNTTVVGMLIDAPRFKEFDNGNKVANIKVSDSWKNKNGEWESVIYEAAFWNNAAEPIMKFFKKGDMIWLNGHINKVSTFETKSGAIAANPVMEFPSWKFVGKGSNTDDKVDAEGEEVDVTE